MNNWLGNNLEPKQWIDFLHQVSENPVGSDREGQLYVEGENFIINYIKPNSEEIVKIDLFTVIETSKFQINKLPADGTLRQTIFQELESLDQRIREIRDKNNLTSVTSDIGFFEDDIQQIAKEYHLQSSKQKDPLSDLLSSINPSTRLSREDLKSIYQLVETDPNLLFQIKEYSPGVLEILMPALDESDQLSLTISILENSNRLNKSNLTKVFNFIFERAERAGESLFVRSLEGGKATLFVDLILKNIDDDYLNATAHKHCREQLINHVFSPNRYAAVFMNERRISLKLMEKAKLLQQKTSVIKLEIENKHRGSGKYQEWMKQRMIGSTSIKQAGGKSSLNWVKAQEEVSQLAAKHKQTGETITLQQISYLHTIMSAGEPDVSSPGKYREKSALTSGGWTHTYCAPWKIEHNMNELISWLNASIDHCKIGEGNPVLLGAETYQRLVSLHPYENGNGRIARLTMDYVLELFNIPPPALGSNVLDGLFPLDPVRENHDHFFQKIIDGIELTYKYFSQLP